MGTWAYELPKKNINYFNTTNTETTQPTKTNGLVTTDPTTNTWSMTPSQVAGNAINLANIQADQQGVIGSQGISLMNNTLPSYNNIASWLQSMGSGSTGNLPSWLQIDWKNPYTADELLAMSEMQDLTTQQQGQKLSTNAQSNLARRGLSAPSTTSTADIAASTGLQNYLTSQGAQNKYNLTKDIVARGDTLRSEQTNNYQQLLQSLANYQQAMWPYTSTAQAQNTYSNLYGIMNGNEQANQAAQNQGWMSLISAGLGML